jgi:signal transduction histidine kinase
MTTIPLILFISAAFALWLGAVIQRRASAPGAGAFVGLMAGVALWCLTSAFHGLAPALEEKILWAKVQYVAVAAVPPLWFVFLSDYVGATWAADRRLRFALALMSAATIILAFTNDWHRLIWTSVELSAAGTAIYRHGIAFWLIVVVNYTLVFMGILVLASATRRTPALFRGQLLALIAASVFPWVFNAIYLFGPGAPRRFDATPLSFALSGVLFTWALYRTYLFDLIPVAHDVLIDSLSDAVIVVDPHGRVLDANVAARQLAGETPPMGQPVMEAFAVLKGSTLELSPHPSSALVATNDAEPIHYDVRTMPVRARDGRSAAWVMLLRDVSAQMRAQAERDALESRVQEQQKREGLSILASGLAHDFNNLLAGIVGNADLLALQIPPSSGMGSHIGAIILGAQRAADLVAKMLAYAGERHGSMERIDLDAVIIEMLELLRASAARHCTLEYRGQPAVIVADPTQIRQVVMNLIINAAEAVDEHTGTVTVSTGIERLSEWQLADMRFGADAAPGTYAYMDVRDNGPGMDPETMARIFNPFFTTKPSGHGLGLAAVQGIVRGHRGALHVDSWQDRGSRFCVWFPAAPNQVSDNIARSPSASPVISKS